MKLSDKELATVLAALRNWQEITSEGGGNNPREVMPEHFDSVEPLNTEEIDDLCERLNTADADELRDWRVQLREEIAALGFDNPDDAVPGSKAVEYLGKLYDDLEQMVSL